MFSSGNVVTVTVSMVIVAMIINVVAEVIVAIVWLVYWCFFLGLNGFMDLRILCVQQVSKNVDNEWKLNNGH